MGCEPLTPALVVHEEPLSRRQALVKAYKERKSIDTHSSDPEAHEMEESRRDDSPLDLNHYRIVDEVWHFCSVDWGSKCEALSSYREILAKSWQIYVSVIIPSTIQRLR
jgi:hypothetical protein